MNLENINPGDWYIALGGLKVLSKGGGEYAFLVADCQYRDHARLISAAPDLLEACENLENDDSSIPAHAWALIQGAIKKATGR